MTPKTQILHNPVTENTIHYIPHPDFANPPMPEPKKKRARIVRKPEKVEILTAKKKA